MTAIYNWLVSFAAWLLSLVESVLQFFVDVLNWIFKYAAYVVYSIFESVLDGLASALSSIPRPSVFAQAESLFCQNFSLLGYAASGIDIGTPLALIFSAYVVRFIIRRLPVIG